MSGKAGAGGMMEGKKKSRGTEPCEGGEAQDMAVGRLAGGVAHDLNNLAIIIGLNSRQAAKALGEGGPASAYLRQISEASARVAGLARRLFILSGRHRAAPEPVDLNEAVREALKGLAGGVGVKTELDPGLAAIMARRADIMEMVTGLVLSARDSAPEGGGIVVKTANAPEAAGHPHGLVSLVVSGPGAWEGGEAPGRPFEPFNSPFGQGSGIELAVADAVVKQSGGSMAVSSEPGRGTEFTLSMPAAAQRPSAPEKPGGPEELAGDGQRVLLVEDEAQLRKGIAIVLARNGYKVFEASAAKEAASVFERENGRFDLIFTDLVLKDKNGIQLVEELGAVEKKARVLLTSGYMDIEAQWPAVKEKGFYFLQKPFEIEEMLRAVKRSLTGSEC